jgi:hypothetical protein
MLYSRMLENDRVIRQAQRLSRLDRAARADLAGVFHNASRAGVTAAFIAYLEDCAAKNGVRIAALQPAPPTAQEDSAGAGADGLISQPVTITAAGRFPALLRFVADLSHQRTLLEITGTQFALRTREAGASGKPLLDAAIQAVLFRFTSPHAQGAPGADVR